MPPTATSLSDQEVVLGTLSDLDFSIEETVFASPGEETGYQPAEMWSTFGTTCWSCNSCSCSDTCTGSCNC